MQVLAQYHSEVKHIYIPEKYKKIFQGNDFLTFKQIIKNNNKKSLENILKKEKKQYNKIIEKHKKLKKTTISHNDTSKNNWISTKFNSHGKDWYFERMIDFDEANWGQEYLDVEKVLFDVDFKKRLKYKKEYIQFRKIFEDYLGYDYKISLNKFNQLSNERGYISTIRYLSYGINSNFYLKNLKYYKNKLNF